MKHIIIIAYLLMSTPGLAKVRGPHSPGMHLITGYCTDIEKTDNVSIHFCTKQVEDEGTQEIFYMLYIRLIGDKLIKLDNSTIHIVHAASLQKISLEVDGMRQYDYNTYVKSFSSVSYYYINLPEIWPKRFKDDIPFEIHFSTDGKILHKIKFTKEELQEIRMVFSIEKLLPKNK
jgi:hypothetical protein